MTGGTGDDVYSVDDPGDRVFELAGEGIDTINTTVNFSLAAGLEIERLAAGNPASTVGLRLIGNEFANHLAAHQRRRFSGWWRRRRCAHRPRRQRHL